MQNNPFEFEIVIVYNLQGWMSCPHNALKKIIYIYQDPILTLPPGYGLVFVQQLFICIFINAASEQLKLMFN